MKKEFDKKSFQKAQKKLLLACFSIGIIGIASIICAFAVGNGIKFPSRADKEEEQYQDFLDQITPDEDDDFGTDPKDYYGDYFFEKDFVIQKISVGENGATVTIFDIFSSKSDQFSAQYASAEYCLATFEKESPALILYQDSMSSYQTLWLEKTNGSYTLSDDEKNMYTKTVISLESLNKDPKNYYGTYYAEENFLIETIDITADSVTITSGNPLVGEKSSVTYHYAFVCGEYSQILNHTNCDALLLYTDEIKNVKATIFLEKDDDGNYILSNGLEKTYTQNEISWESVLNDPKDYHGSYYGAEGYVVHKLTITDDQLSLTVQQAMKDDVTETYQYSYLPAGYAKLLYNKQKEAIIAYKDNANEVSHLFWLTKYSDGSYRLENTKEIEYTAEEITFADLVDDPMNYYGTYQFNSANLLVLNENRTAVFTLNGEAKEYEFFYADRAWLDQHNVSYSPAIVLFERGSTTNLLFKIDDHGNMIYGNQYNFQKQ